MDVPLVFLSYTRRQPDESWAVRVVRSVDERLGLEMWFDKRGIRVGQPFDAEIEAAIRRSRAVIFLGSTSSLLSAPCRLECEFALDIGKPLLPLFIEAIDWSGFPVRFHKLHFEQIFRAADDDDELTWMVAQALTGAGVPVDPTRIPRRSQRFDEWAGSVHPGYGRIRTAAEGTLRGYVEACSAKLNLRPEHGYHHLNLALLLLHLGDGLRAQSHAEAALRDLPGNAEAYYFAALVAAAHEPLALATRARIETVLRLADNAIGLDTGVRPSEVAALPWLLKAIVAYDYYVRNGLSARFGTPEQLLEEASRRPRAREEVERLLDTLKNLSPASRQAAESLR